MTMKGSSSPGRLLNGTAVKLRCQASPWSLASPSNVAASAAHAQGHGDVLLAGAPHRSLIVCGWASQRCGARISPVRSLSNTRHRL